MKALSSMMVYYSSLGQNSWCQEWLALQDNRYSRGLLVGLPKLWGHNLRPELAME